jgi:hypothetical protein
VGVTSEGLAVDLEAVADLACLGAGVSQPKRTTASNNHGPIVAIADAGAALEQRVLGRRRPRSGFGVARP